MNMNLSWMRDALAGLFIAALAVMIGLLLVTLLTKREPRRGVVDETDAEMNAADKWRERGE